MRISSLNCDLKADQFPVFSKNVHAALEYFTGSPIRNKESKVFETCAIALGMGNSDTLAAALQADAINASNAVDLVKSGLCPFSQQPLDSNGRHACGTVAHVAEGVLHLDAFPRGMTKLEQIQWAAQQSDDHARILGQTPSIFCPVDPQGHEPHWHAAIAGYRETLSDWFESDDDNEAVTVGYWHTDSDFLQNRPLGDRLAQETHYELVLSRSESLYQQVLTLYRMFKLGNRWHLSQDKVVVLDVVDPKDYAGAPGTTLLVGKIIDTLMEFGVKQPARLMDVTSGPLNMVGCNDMARAGLTNLLAAEDISNGFVTRQAQSLEGLIIKLFELAKVMQESFAMGDPVFLPEGNQRWVQHRMVD